MGEREAPPKLCRTAREFGRTCPANREEVAQHRALEPREGGPQDDADVDPALRNAAERAAATGDATLPGPITRLGGPHPGRQTLLPSPLSPEVEHLVDGDALARALPAPGLRLGKITLTAQVMSEDRWKQLEGGCDAYARDAIDKARLVATCAAWIERLSPLSAGT